MSPAIAELDSYVIRLGQGGSAGSFPPFSTASNNLTNASNTYYPSTWTGGSPTADFGDIITDAITLAGASWTFPVGPTGTFQYDNGQTLNGSTSPAIKTFTDLGITNSLPVGTVIDFNADTETDYKYYFAVADAEADAADFTANPVRFADLQNNVPVQIVDSIAITVDGHPYKLYAMNNSANDVAASFERTA
jgi:hypothetical protein